jgi:hypothetical protein
LGRDRDQAAAHHAGLDRDPPSAAKLREYNRMISRFAEAHHARPCLLQILITRNLGQNGRLQLGHDSLRGPGSGEQAGEKAQNRNKNDRQNRFRSRPRDKSGMIVAIGFNPRRARSNALPKMKASTTIGVRKSTPPRTVIRRKWEIAFISSSYRRPISEFLG